MYRFARKGYHDKNYERQCSENAHPTSRGPAFITKAHRSFFRHLLSSSRVDVTGDAPGVAMTCTHFSREAWVSMLRLEAWAGVSPAPVTNRTGFTSSYAYSSPGTLSHLIT